MGPILMSDEGIVVASERTVLRASPGAPYETLGPWSSTSSLAISAEGALAWTDRHAGLLWVRD